MCLGVLFACMSMPCAQGDPKGALDSLGLELRIFISYYVSAGY